MPAARTARSAQCGVRESGLVRVPQLRNVQVRRFVYTVLFLFIETEESRELRVRESRMRISPSPKPRTLCTEPETRLTRLARIYLALVRPLLKRIDMFVPVPTRGEHEGSQVVRPHARPRPRPDPVRVAHTDTSTESSVSSRTLGLPSIAWAQHTYVRHLNGMSACQQKPAERGLL